MNVIKIIAQGGLKQNLKKIWWNYNMNSKFSSLSP